MGISDRIEAFICELTKEDDGWVELGRNELAGIFNCVPSQINYVIRTRFTPQRGYAVESRRGGGGYLKIRRISETGLRQLEALPDKISEQEAIGIIEAAKAAAKDEAVLRIIKAAVTDRELKKNPEADILRASILKSMLGEAVRI